MNFHTESTFSRRSLLQVGALGAGLTLADGLRLRAADKAKGGLRSAIFVFLEGGPSHQDTFDLKPQAAAEFRGEFRPIDTSVAGVQICEHMPNLARDFGRYAIVRGVTHNLADHGIGKKYVLTGNLPTPVLQYPEYGSVVARQHPSARDLPTYVAIDEAFVGPGYLGTQYSALTAEKPRHGFPYRVRGVTLDDGLTVARYSRQKQLLDDLDTAFRRVGERGGGGAGGGAAVFPYTAATCASTSAVPKSIASSTLPWNCELWPTPAVHAFGGRAPDGDLARILSGWSLCRRFDGLAASPMYRPLGQPMAPVSTSVPLAKNVRPSPVKPAPTWLHSPAGTAWVPRLCPTERVSCAIH